MQLDRLFWFNFNPFDFVSEMRYFIQRLIARGDYESAAILAKHNESWLPSELLNQDELKPHSLFTYRLFRANKVRDFLCNCF